MISNVGHLFMCLLVIWVSSLKTGDLGLIPGLGRSPGGGHGNPVQYFFPGESHGLRSLVGYGLWGHKESDMTEVIEHAHAAN